MFAQLSRFGQILVTGPQRSGTTICAMMIAHDLGYRFLPEEVVSVRSLDAARRLLAEESEFVLQCPGLCRWIHELAGPEVAVVLMRRPLAEILESQQRIGWTGRRMQRELAGYGLTEGCIAQVKYDFWASHQRALIPNAFEIEYASLADHPLWLDKEARAGFGPRQVELGCKRVKCRRF